MTQDERIKAIAAEDGVTPEVVEAGINEVKGLLDMIASADEIADDSLPRFTTCPLCGGKVAFAPLIHAQIPRVLFTTDTPWGICRAEWKTYAMSCFEKQAAEQGVEWSQAQRSWFERIAYPYALILECHQCGKGFDPRQP